MTPPQLLAALSVLLVPLARAQFSANTPAILQGPVSQVAGEHDTVKFSCTARAAEDIKWIVNGSELEASSYDGAGKVSKVPGSVLYYSSVTFPAQLQFNSTRVRCRAFQQHNTVESSDAYLTIADAQDNSSHTSPDSGSDSWHILALCIAMALYVAFTTPLVIVLAVMHVVRKRKETTKTTQKGQVADVRSPAKGEDEEGGDYIQMASVSVIKTDLRH